MTQTDAPLLVEKRLGWISDHNAAEELVQALQPTHQTLRSGREDNSEFLPRLCHVEDMAYQLLRTRDALTGGTRWAYNFVKRQLEPVSVLTIPN